MRVLLVLVMCVVGCGNTPKKGSGPAENSGANQNNFPAENNSNGNNFSTENNNSASDGDTGTGNNTPMPESCGPREAWGDFEGRNAGCYAECSTSRCVDETTSCRDGLCIPDSLFYACRQDDDCESGQRCIGGQCTEAYCEYQESDSCWYQAANCLDGHIYELRCEIFADVTTCECVRDEIVETTIVVDSCEYPEHVNEVLDRQCGWFVPGADFVVEI